MPATPRTYSRSADFPGGAVNTTKLKAEIEASSIATLLLYIETNIDVIDIVFDAALPAGEATTLDGDVTGPAGGLIAAHDNVTQADPEVLKTTDPTVADDSSQGYAVNSIWNNTATDNQFVCLDATKDAAIWKSTTDTGGGVFGTELSSGASEAEVSTTSTTFVQMFRHTTATLPAGDYYISWFFALRTDQKSIVGQCQLDDAVVLAQDFNRRAGVDFTTTCGGGAVFTLTNAAHFIDFDLRDVGDGPSTAFMSKMRVSLWRVS